MNREIIQKYEVNLDIWPEKLEKLKQVNKEYYDKVKPEFISLINEGLFFKRIGKLDYAKMAFKESINLNPDSLVSYFHLTNVYMEEEEHEKMIKLLEEAKNRGLSSKTLDNNLGYAYEKLGRKKEAIKLYKKATTKFGETPYAEAYANLARIDYENALYRRALNNIKKALELNPNSFFNYYTEGTIYISLDSYGEAIESLEKAIRFNPEYAKAYHNLGVAYNMLGMHEFAEKNFRKAIELDPAIDTTKELLRIIESKE